MKKKRVINVAISDRGIKSGVPVPPRKAIKNIVVSTISLYIIAILTISFSSCKKLIDINAPSTSVNGNNIYENNETASSVLTGIYTTISQNAFISPLNMSVLNGLSADELDLFNGVTNGYKWYYTNSLSSTNTTDGINDFWNITYPAIFSANSAIEGLNSSSSLSPEIKKQLLGEALFIRGFCYFYLVNLYGAIPLPLNTDYKVNSTLPRTPIINVYEQIINDLKEAKNLLSDKFLDARVLNETVERTRPNKAAASAMLARTYLFIGDYFNAETEATSIIANSAAFSLCTLDDIFLKNSREAIWQIQPVGSGVSSNTREGRFFILTNTGPTLNRPVYLSSSLLNSFETGDLRKQTWIKNVKVDDKVYYYPYKYKIGSVNTGSTEYSMVLRLGELYLIRAEAKIQQEKIQEGIEDINIMRERANDKSLPIADQLQPLPLTLSKEDALNAILHERQVELFTEWGHRWFDLKRTQKIDNVMNAVAPLKGANWNTQKQLYPIPQVDIDRNPMLKGNQNPGY